MTWVVTMSGRGSADEHPGRSGGELGDELASPARAGTPPVAVAARRISGPRGRTARRNAADSTVDGVRLSASRRRTVTVAPPGRSTAPGAATSTRDIAGAATVARRSASSGGEAAVDAAQHGPGERRLAQLADRRGRRAELLPRRRHEVLLLLLHDGDAEAGDGSQARVEVERRHPRWRAGRSCCAPPGGCRRSAVRRPDPSTLPSSRVAGRSSTVRSAVANVDGSGPRGVAPDRTQHAAEGDGAEIGDAEAEAAHRQRPARRRSGRLARREPASQRLEVAGGAGAELPVVEHGQVDVVGSVVAAEPRRRRAVPRPLSSIASPRPARRPTSNAGTTQATYAVSAASRRGHSSRDRFCVLAAASWSASGVPVPASSTWAWAHAHESSRFGQLVGRPGRLGDAQHRPAARRVDGDRHAGLAAYDDEHDPRTQLSGSGRRWPA